MQASSLVGGVINAIAARLHAGAATPSPSSPIWDAEASDVDGWIVTLASLLIVFTVGSAAARLANRLMRKPAPELTVLLNQSAAFYGRWAGDRQANAPSSELKEEAARCRRIIELLEARAAADGGSGPAVRGPITGLQTWISLLHKQIQGRIDTYPGIYAQPVETFTASKLKYCGTGKFVGIVPALHGAGLGELGLQLRRLPIPHGGARAIIPTDSYQCGDPGPISAGPVTESFEDRLELIAGGQAIAVLPVGDRRSCLRADLATVPVEGFPTSKVMIATRSGDPNPLVADFLSRPPVSTSWGTARRLRLPVSGACGR